MSAEKNPIRFKLYSIYTYEESILKDIFLESLEDDWEIHINYWGKLGGDGGDSGTPEFSSLMRRRIEYLVGVIKKEKGNTIIWSDIDMQFFGKCSHLIEKALADNDMVFLSECWPGKYVNGGFAVIRCNPKTRLFYETVLQADIESLEYWDQSAINTILEENAIGVKWNILPRQFWAKSHSGNPPLDIVLHHANVTFPSKIQGKRVGSVEQKIEQLRNIRTYVTLRRRWKWFFCIIAVMKNCIPGRLQSILKSLKNTHRKQDNA